MTFDLLFTGDIVLDEPDPDYWLSGIAPALQRADLAIGHLEVAHSRRGRELAGDVPAPGAPPEHLAALARAGISALTLAGNHIADCGPEGIADTIDELDRLAIAHCGAGANLERARAPAWLALGGVRVALLSYNCVGPESSWASADRAGCAYLRVRTETGVPVAPAAPLAAADPEAFVQLGADLTAARAQGAALRIVALHKGIVHTPARLAPYERPLAHAAIEAGADLVISHHAHILRGIEFHKGRPIFHGLGNGCVVTRALSPDQSHPARAAWARRRRTLFGFEPDPAYTLAPFHPEAVNALLGYVRVRDGRIAAAGFVPVHVEPPGRPVLANPVQRARIAAYVEHIGREAGLPALHFTAEADMIRVDA
jgi:poly-gamma-glutamate capsule biosynthesis protein CapA/YwtB (metallophosphatase superfamily)